MYDWPGEDRKPGFKHEAHAFVPLRSGRKSKASLPWVWCQRCGLVLLRNPATDWCRQHGCNYDDHPQYAETMRRLLKG